MNESPFNRRSCSQKNLQPPSLLLQDYQHQNPNNLQILLRASHATKATQYHVLPPPHHHPPPIPPIIHSLDANRPPPRPSRRSLHAADVPTRRFLRMQHVQPLDPRRSE
jgi:hypothetical protein